MDFLNLKDAIPQLQTALQAVVDKAAADLANLVAQQDGWTLTINVPPIQIPPITVRLTKPKEVTP